MSLTKHYRYETKFSGIRFFKVIIGSKTVVQNVYTLKTKKGKAYNIGISLIDSERFNKNYAKQLTDQRWVREISKSQWDKAFEETLNKLL